jgi:hypothetical protein
MALPSAMPDSTAASMIVNAYGRSVTSIRNHTISSASDITPERMNVQRMARRALGVRSSAATIDRAAGKPRGRQKQKRRGQQGLQCDPELLDPFEEDRGCEGAHPDADFDQAKRPERRTKPSCQSTGAEAAQGEAAHEAGQHGAGGVDRHTEDQREQSQPHQLVDEGARPREKEQERE